MALKRKKEPAPLFTLHYSGPYGPEEKKRAREKMKKKGKRQDEKERKEKKKKRRNLSARRFRVQGLGYVV
jgi:SOS response regulatory protein OraA/RecX